MQVSDYNVRVYTAFNFCNPNITFAMPCIIATLRSTGSCLQQFAEYERTSTLLVRFSETRQRKITPRKCLGKIAGQNRDRNRKVRWPNWNLFLFLHILKQTYYFSSVDTVHDICISHKLPKHYIGLFHHISIFLMASMLKHKMIVLQFVVILVCWNV